MSSKPVPEGWLVVEVSRPREPDVSARLIDALSSVSGRGIEERDETLIAYFSDRPHRSREVLDRVARIVDAVAGGLGVRIDHRWQPHEDWVENWRQGVRPRRIGERLVVAPSWDDPGATEGELVLILDPGIAFGTAEHPTTRGCLRLMERRVEPASRIADIGTGSGILSIAALLLGAERVLAVDPDPWACAATLENARANEVEDRIDIVQAAVDPAFLREPGPFDGLVSNIETDVLRALLPGFADAVRPGGWLVLAGIQRAEVGEMVGAANRSGFELADEDHEDDSTWWAGGFRKIG